MLLELLFHIALTPLFMITFTFSAGRVSSVVTADSNNAYGYTSSSTVSPSSPTTTFSTINLTNVDINANETKSNSRDADFPTTKTVNYRNTLLNCSSLRTGQYRCDEIPEIDPESQRAVNCSKETRTVKVPCFPVEGIYCNHVEHTGSTIGFYKEVPCRWTNGKRFSVALLLSVFLGWLGIDRFYLGYPAIGLLKLCTFGFMFLGHLVDVLLIAIQAVGPADGSDYVVNYYGAGLIKIVENNETYIKSPDYSIR